MTSKLRSSATASSQRWGLVRRSMGLRGVGVVGGASLEAGDVGPLPCGAEQRH